MNVQVYTINSCPFCIKAKELLNAQKVPFQEIKVDKSNSSQVSELVAKTKMKTFPQIMFKETVIGGYTDLEKLHQEKGLSHLLEN